METKNLLIGKNHAVWNFFDKKKMLKFEKLLLKLQLIQEHLYEILIERN